MSQMGLFPLPHRESILSFEIVEGKINPTHTDSTGELLGTANHGDIYTQVSVRKNPSSSTGERQSGFSCCTCHGFTQARGSPEYSVCL